MPASSVTPPAGGSLPYGLYAAALFVCMSLTTLVLLLVVPRLEWRRALTHRAARAYFAAAGMRLTVDGLERLPPSSCVLVANHASYLDGVVMTAALPPRFAFVIKREMDAVPLASRLLRRIGAHFVDRGNRHRGGQDARRVLRAAGRGEAMVFFPEGTFSKEIGLLRFHSGAFVTAARAGMPVVPAVIHGTRAAMPATRRLPRRAHLHVQVLEPVAVAPDGAAQDEAVRLRDAARAAILQHLGEPDLEQKA